MMPTAIAIARNFFPRFVIIMHLPLVNNYCNANDECFLWQFLFQVCIPFANHNTCKPMLFSIRCFSLCNHLFISASMTELFRC